MDDKQKKRLNKQFAVTWFLLLVMILVVLFLATSKKVETHNFVGQPGPKGDSIVGPIGPAGESIKGEKGDPGKTMVIENNTTIYRTETIKGEKGDAGEKGEPGMDAPVLQVQVNPETKDLEYRYSGDTVWSILIPCEQLLKECDDGSAAE